MIACRSAKIRGNNTSRGRSSAEVCDRDNSGRYQNFQLNVIDFPSYAVGRSRSVDSIANCRRDCLLPRLLRSLEGCFVPWFVFDPRSGVAPVEGGRHDRSLHLLSMQRSSCHRGAVFPPTGAVEYFAAVTARIQGTESWFNWRFLPNLADAINNEMRQQGYLGEECP